MRQIRLDIGTTSNLSALMVRTFWNDADPFDARAEMLDVVVVW